MSINAHQIDFYLPFPHFSLLSLPHLSLALSPLFERTVYIENDPDKRQGLKRIQIFRICPHLDNTKITSSSQLLQDTLIV